MKIKNFNDYEIFPEEGKIWSLKRKRFIGYQHPNGYWHVTLTDDDGKQHYFLLSRVIWMSVHGDIPQNYEINHLDEDPNNNVISNLSCCSHLENIRYGSRTARAAAHRDYEEIGRKITEKLTNRQDQSKQVAAYNKDDVLVMTFPSTMEAGRHGFDRGNVAACCRGERKSHRGYKWRYLN